MLEVLYSSFCGLQLVDIIENVIKGLFEPLLGLEDCDYLGLYNISVCFVRVLIIDIIS